MSISFNSNIKLLMGGSYCGGTEWNKPANDIDKCFKLYYIRQGHATISDKKGIYDLVGPNLYFINGNVIQSQKCIKKMVVDWVHFKPDSVYFNYILQFIPSVITSYSIHYTKLYDIVGRFVPFGSTAVRTSH